MSFTIKWISSLLIIYISFKKIHCVFIFLNKGNEDGTK